MSGNVNTFDFIVQSSFPYQSANCQRGRSIAYLRGRVKVSLQPFFSLHMGAFIQRWQCLHQVDVSCKLGCTTALA